MSSTIQKHGLRNVPVGTVGPVKKLARQDQNDRRWLGGEINEGEWERSGLSTIIIFLLPATSHFLNM
jgi:hypothetical protein